MSTVNSWKAVLKIYGPVIVMAGAAFVIAYQFVEPAPPDRMTIAAGAKGGAYYIMAQRYKIAIEAAGITVTVRETSGSMDNLASLRDDEDPATIGFVQSGLTTSGTEDNGPILQSLGSLYFEPLWVFYRPGLEIRDLRDLSGLNIDIGPIGSGTRKMAEILLAANGINISTPNIVGLADNETAATKLRSGALDAMFTIGSGSSDAIRALLVDPDISLLSFDRAEAYARTYPYLSRLLLPEGAIDLVQNIPAHDVYLIAPVAMLVARDDIHPALIDLLLISAKEIHSGAGLFEQSGTFPSPDFTDLPVPADVRRFYERGPSFLQRYLPFWAATMIDRWLVMLLPILTLALPLLRIMPPLYTWRVRSRIYRWYQALRDIELNTGSTRGRDKILEELDRIETEVSHVDVPLSYMDELYDLRLHIRFLKNKLIGTKDTS